MPNCPKCFSENIRLVRHLDSEYIVCNECGYDQRSEYDIIEGKETGVRDSPEPRKK